METLGKITFKQLEPSDHNMLQEFLDTCRVLGYENNTSFKSIKLDTMTMPYGQFFIGVLDNKIVTFAGVHIMEDHRYRCMFRGAALPGYTTGLTGLRSSLQVIYLLNMQIDLILSIDPLAEFFVTTNVEQNVGKSSKMNTLWLPRMHLLGIMTLENDSFYYNHVLQRLWRINVSKYKEWRLKAIF